MWPFTRRLAVLAAFLMPIGYVGIILGVVSHELLGHGLTAILLGGHFEGFVIKSDGMGWAIAYPAQGAPEWHDSVIWAGGVAATMVVGLVLLGLGILCRRSLWLCTSLIILAQETLLDSAAYTFWSALYPGTVGDAARIVELTGSGVVQGLLVALGVTLTVTATVIPFKLLLDAAESWLTAGGYFTSSQRAVVIVVLFLVPVGGGYYDFDWNQLIEGIGYVPAHANLLLVLPTALALWIWPRRWMPSSTHAESAGFAITIAWSAGLMTVLVTAMWLSYGVSW